MLGLNVYWHVKKQDTAKVPGIKFISHTVELPLNLDSEAITANFSKQIRQQARIAGIVRHHHAATRRLDEQVDKNLIGRANKYLTVKNILYFKEQGYATFDFGGYAKDTTNESLKGINNYKLLFGGTVVECVNYFSYTYWFFKKLSGLLGMRGKV